MRRWSMFLALFGFSSGVAPSVDDMKDAVHISAADRGRYCSSGAAWVGRVTGHTEVPAGRSHHTLIELDVERTIFGDTYAVETVLIEDAYGRAWGQVGGPPRGIEPIEGRRFLVAQAGDDFRFAHPVDTDADVKRVLDALEKKEPCISWTPLEPDTLTHRDVAGWCLADSVWVGRVDGVTIETKPRGLWGPERKTIIEFTVEQTMRGEHSVAGQVLKRGTYRDGLGWKLPADDRHRLRPHAGRRYLVAQNRDGETLLTHPVSDEADVAAAIEELERRTPTVCVSPS